MVDIALCMNYEECDLKDDCLRAQAPKMYPERISSRQMYVDFLKDLPNDDSCYYQIRRFAGINADNR